MAGAARPGLRHHLFAAGWGLENRGPWGRGALKPEAQKRGLGAWPVDGSVGCAEKRQLVCSGSVLQRWIRVTW